MMRYPPQYNTQEYELLLQCLSCSTLEYLPGPKYIPHYHKQAYYDYIRQPILEVLRNNIPYDEQSLTSRLMDATTPPYWNAIYKTSIQDIMLLIESDNPLIKIIAKWRIEIGH